MKNIIEWIGVYKEYLEGVDINICIESEEKSFDFRQFLYDFVIITIISLTIKGMIALSVGQSFINLY